VKHKFLSQKSRDLSLEKGNVMLVEEQHNDWYFGYNASDATSKGWFPVSFVEDCTEQVSSETASSGMPSMNSPQKQQNNHLSPQKPTSQESRSKSPVKRPAPKPPGSSKTNNTSANQLKSFVAAYSYHGNEKSDLSFESGQVILVERQGNDGWWVGRIGEKRGNFPGNYVVPQEEFGGESPVVEQMGSGSASVGGQSTGGQPSRQASFQEYQVTAIYTYEAQTTEDLPFQSQEIITVIGMVDADWLQGRNSNGQVGIFPSNYVSE
jgi:hypothetical protein